MEPEGDKLRRLAEAIELPDAPRLADLHRRVARRRTRRMGLAAAAVVSALVATTALVTTTQRDKTTQVAAVGSTLTLPDQPEWLWVSPEKMYSRDGSATGYGLRVGQSDEDLLIYLADGGACFDADSCENASAHFDEDDLQSFIERSSVVTANRGDAPFAGWEVVVVPGSTADLHHGNDPSTDVPGGPSDQEMIGARNLRRVLADLAARSGESSQRRVVLAGSGAGAFGAILSQSTVRAAYPGIELTTIVDGAVVPPSGRGIPDCVLDRWEKLWDIDVPQTWGLADGRSGDHPASDVYRRLAKRFPESRFGFLAAAEDRQLRSWYARGPDCSPSGGSISTEEMRSGVDEVEALVADLSPWSSFVVDGVGEGILASPSSGVRETALPLWRWIVSLIDPP